MIIKKAIIIQKSWKFYKTKKLIKNNITDIFKNFMQIKDHLKKNKKSENNLEHLKEVFFKKLDFLDKQNFGNKISPKSISKIFFNISNKIFK